MTGIRRSLLFSFGEKYIIITINISMMAAIARLLTPAEVGLFMVGAAVVLLIETFREFGVTNYLIQEQEITPEGVRTVFTVALTLSVLFAAGLFALSGPIAAFYGEQCLTEILHVSALSFLLVPFSAPIMALLRRDMAFDAIAVINLTAAVVNCIAVIALAILGFGSMSLAWASLLSGIAAVSTAILFRPQLWVFRPSFTAWRRVLSFGGYSSCTALLNTFYTSLPQLMLGRILDFGAVGLFSRAVMLCQTPDRLILNALSPVILPALSARVRSGGDLKSPYLRAMTYMTAVQWPFFLCVALLADPVVHVLLGAQWSEVAPLVRILSLASLTGFPAFMTYPLMISIGRVRDTLAMSLITIPVSVMLFCFASFLGLESAAASQFLAMPLQIYVALTFIRRQMPFGWRELATATWKSAIVALCAAAAPACAVALAGFRFDLSVPDMVVAGAAAVLGWVVGLAVTGHPLLMEVRRVTRIVWEGFNQRSMRGPATRKGGESHRAYH